LGYGGPCFPRDNKAFSFLAKQLGCQPWLAEATDKVNTIQVNRVIKKVKSTLRGKGTVTILGLSYKPNTEIVEASQSLEIAKNLSSLGYKVNACMVLNFSFSTTFFPPIFIPVSFQLIFN